MGKSKFNFRIVPYKHSTFPLQLDKIIDTQYNEPDSSAIDTFIEKTRELNKLIGDKPKELPLHLSNLILLGYVSAVESFIRKLLRRLIIVDNASKIACGKCQLTYSAAISYDKGMLPESLMENSSFSAKGTIKGAIRDFLGIKNNIYPREVEEVLDRYSNVCQIRHCIVHRFGLLGSENAIKLGLKEYGKLLNKPVKLDYDSLQEVFVISNNTVKVLNNFLFNEILARTGECDNVFWQWDDKKNEEKFKEYFDIFYSNELSEVDYDQARQEAYRKFKDAMEK